VKNINEARRAFSNVVLAGLKQALSGDEKYSLDSKDNNDVFNSTTFVLAEKNNNNNCVEGSYYYDAHGDLILQWCK